MYYNGGGNPCCNNYPTYGYPVQCGSNNSSTYALILVLFILLVIVIGCKWAN